MIETTYKSKFKKLIVSGCSFTHNRIESSCTWANLLADLTGMEIVNLANSGAGNGHIANSLIMYLSRVKPDVDSTLIMTMWSGIDRTDWIVKQCKSIQHFNYKFLYDNYTEHYLVGAPQWGSKEFKNYFNLQSDKSFSVQSWLHFEALTNFLKFQKYTYRYTTFNDILYGNGMSNINFLKQITELDLSMDLTNWILTKEIDSLGEFAIYHNELIPNDGHPTLNAHERWTREKLIPTLLQQKILYDSI